MSDKPARLKYIRGFFFIVLGLQLLFAVLLLGKYPLLFRGGIYAQAQADREGMRLAVYNNPHRSGPAGTRFTPGASARLEAPHTSLEAYGIWQVKKSGTYTLALHCDDYGSLFLDGRSLIHLEGISADNFGQAVVPLQPGPHLLVVHLFNEPEKGFFSLEVQGPGEKSLAPLPSQNLRPWNPEKASYFWWAVATLFPWVRRGIFWISFMVLLLAALAFLGAKTFKQAALNGVLILGSCLLAAVLGEIAARLFFAPPQKVSFREKAAPGHRTDQRERAFTIPTERGYRHAPLSELVIENPAWSPKIPLVYKTNSLGYRNPEIGPKQRKRFLFLGDSITFGQGVNEEWTFVRLLEKLARANGENWETVNGAVEGLGTNGELAVLNETGLALKPDVVLLDFYLNDFLESPGIILSRLPGMLDRSQLAHKMNNFVSSHLFLTASGKKDSVIQPMQKAPDEIFAWREEFKTNSTVLPRQGRPDQTAQAFHEAVLQNFEDWGGTFSPHAWERLRVLLEEFARLSKEHRFQLVLAVFPVRPQLETDVLFDYPQKRLSQIAGDLKIPCFDLLPVFKTEYRKDPKNREPLYFDHCHLTPHGNQVAARALYDFLKRTDSKKP